MSEILVAKSTFVARVEGRTVQVRKGVTRVRAGHPVTHGREHLFETIQPHPAFELPQVEQATKAPGESRTTVRPDKQALLAQARELGHDVDGRTSARKLEELIASGPAEDPGAGENS